MSHCSISGGLQWLYCQNQARGFVSRLYPLYLAVVKLAHRAEQHVFNDPSEAEQFLPPFESTKNILQSWWLVSLTISELNADSTVMCSRWFVYFRPKRHLTLYDGMTFFEERVFVISFFNVWRVFCLFVLFFVILLIIYWLMHGYLWLDCPILLAILYIFISYLCLHNNNKRFLLMSL